MKRGRAYQCKKCCYIGERKRTEGHIYKHHISLEEAPFYCTLCLFRSTKQEDLVKHVKNFLPHLHQKKTRSIKDEAVYLKRSQKPYYLKLNEDIAMLSKEQSDNHWRCAKENAKKISSVSQVITQPSLHINQEASTDFTKSTAAVGNSPTHLEPISSPQLGYFLESLGQFPDLLDLSHLPEPSLQISPYQADTCANVPDLDLPTEAEFSPDYEENVSPTALISCSPTKPQESTVTARNSVVQTASQQITPPPSHMALLLDIQRTLDSISQQLVSQQAQMDRLSGKLDSVTREVREFSSHRFIPYKRHHQSSTHSERRRFSRRDPPSPFRHRRDNSRCHVRSQEQ